MAIIACPECGGKISSTSNKCIHCGCSIQVCQECNAVHMQNVSVCSNCGYKFAIEQEKKLQPMEIFNKWKSDNIVNVFLSYDNYISAIFNVLATILLVVAIISFVQWCNSDMENMILEYKDVLEQSKNLLLFFTVFSILADFDSIVEHYSKVRLGDYAIRTKYDLNKAIYEIEKDKLSNHVMIDKLIYASFYLQNFQYKEKSLINAITTSLCSIVASIFFYVFISNLLEFVASIKVLQIENLNILDFEKWWILIVAIVFFIMGIIKGKFVFQHFHSTMLQIP